MSPAELTTRALDDVTVVIPSRNGRARLAETLGPLLGEAFGFAAVVLVDDGSTDGTAEWVAARHPAVRLVRAEASLGRLSAVRNLGLRQCATRYVLLVDNDIGLDRACVDALLAVMEGTPDLLCCTPRLLQGDDPRRIDCDGARLHFLGVTSETFRGALAADRPAGAPFRTSAGGAVMLVDRARMAALGGFDERYVFGWSDGEVVLRGELRGWPSLQVPAATAVHLGTVHGTRRAFGQFSNRYRVLATIYGGRTLLVLGPALLAFEVALTAMALAQGCLRDRLRAVAAVWRERHDLAATRRRIQATRVVSDRALLHGGALDLPAVLRGSAVARAASAVVGRCCQLYWEVARRAL